MTASEPNAKPLWRRRWVLGLASLLGSLVLLFSLRAPLLASAARTWMVNDSPAKADAIVVLGGGANFRSFEAARLYHAGWAPLVLIMNSELRATDNLGLTMPEAELVRRLLLTNAVPAAAVRILGTNLTSTFDEAVTVTQWVKESHAQALLIPTGPFHSRRVRWIFHKLLQDSARLTITSIGPEQCRDWWKKESTLIDFQNEVVKFGLYRVRY